MAKATAKLGTLNSSTTLGDQSYRVPSSSGGFIPADPIKFCLRFRPPTIAIVYQLLSGSKPRKYVREFKIELTKETVDMDAICDSLFEREKIYFNP
jgi:hypothetical protein